MDGYDFLLETLIVEIKGFQVAIKTNHSLVLPWIKKYIGAWWEAFYNESHPEGSKTIVCVIDADAYASLALSDKIPRQVGTFLGVVGYQYKESNQIIVLSPTRQLAYIHDLASSQITILGHSYLAVALSAAAISCLILEAELENSGYLLFHAGCVQSHLGSFLVLGHKGQGKTTTCLTITAFSQSSLLANDRCFLRCNSDSIEVVPHPHCISIGLGLIQSLGWQDKITQEVRSGTITHPGQKEIVTQQIEKGIFTPLFAPNGKEWKYELFPDDMHKWFGISLTKYTCVDRLLFPSVDKHAHPSILLGNNNTSEISKHLLTNTNQSLLGLSAADQNIITKSHETLLHNLEAIPQFALKLSHEIHLNLQSLREVLL